MESQSTEIEVLVKEYEEGASDVEVCASLKMPMREFDKRLRDDSTFLELVEYGRLAAKAWWLRQSRKSTHDKTFNFQVWYAHMKNRYGWSDKTEISDNSKPLEQLSREQLESELTKALTKKKDKIAQLFAIKNPTVSDGDESEDGSSQVH